MIALVQPLLGMDHRNRHTESGIDLGKLDARRPAADDGQAARQLSGRCRLTVGPRPDRVEALDVRDLRSAADGDDDVARLEPLAAAVVERDADDARRIDVGRVGVEIAELQVADRERLLRADVKVRYAEALAAGRNLEMLGEVSELTERTYRVAQRRVAEGEAAPLERALLQVEAGRLTADRLLAASAGARAVAGLKLAVGLDLTELLTLRGELREPSVALSMDEAIAKALSERPDLKAARAEEERANAEFRLARAERVPDVIGVARYGRVESQFPQFGTTSTGQLVPLRDTDHVLTLGVSIPLPFANRNQGNIETSTARRQAASLRRQFLEQSVRTEVIAAYTQYVAASQAIEAFGQDVVKQSQETIAIIRTSYDLGEVQLLDLLQEQRRLLETQKAYTEILKEHYVARAALEAALSAELR